MSGSVSDYHYDLPAELIANRPAERRDDSRMMVIHRTTGTIEHRQFRDFPTYLQEGDLVVLNDSRVIKARLLAEPLGIEIFLLENLGGTRWKCLCKPGRKLRVGTKLPIAETTAEVLEILPAGERIISFESAPDLEIHGHMPCRLTSSAPPIPQTTNATKPSSPPPPAPSPRPPPACISRRKFSPPSRMPFSPCMSAPGHFFQSKPNASRTTKCIRKITRFHNPPPTP